MNHSLSSPAYRVHGPYHSLTHHTQQPGRCLTIKLCCPYSSEHSHSSSTDHVSAPQRLKNTSATMPSELETAMESLIKVFHRYASREGKTGTLNRRELRELMENELSNFLKSQKDPAAVDKIMKDLDTNGDGQVDFEEFVSLVVGLSIACEQCYQMHMKKTCKK
uniref:S100 calcium binding protein A10a n=2 Tax=Sparus aurata TaxID=8175 RepID=A0A671UNN3_SPAAU